MTVSAGFYKKMQDWIINEHTGNVAYRPFQSNGNPYRAKIFLVGSNPEPIPQIELEDIKMFADSLVDIQLFEILSGQLTREQKGWLNFSVWMKEQLKQEVAFTYVNCYQAEELQQLKQLKKAKDPLYVKGTEIFEEVLNEFLPDVIILNGTSALKMFRESFQRVLIETNSSNETLQQIEEGGVFATLPLREGKNVKVLACRNLMYFGREGASFGHLKKILNEIYGNYFV